MNKPSLNGLNVRSAQDDAGNHFATALSVEGLDRPIYLSRDEVYAVIRALHDSLQVNVDTSDVSLSYPNGMWENYKGSYDALEMRLRTS